tara:strand:- start:406 stop:633 length:228 start_codon:yes stop_codon:yes gene_type:complete
MSQLKMIKHYLESGGKLTPLDALDKFKCMRLAAVIHQLRNEGIKVETKTIKNGQKSYAQYYMKNPIGNKNQMSLI